MKKKLLFSLFILCLFAFKYSDVSKQSPEANSGYSATVVLSATEARELAETYSKANGGSTLGGKIGRSELLQLIQSIPDSKNFVHFRFGIDPQFNQVSLMLSGDKTLFENQSQIEYYRNGSSLSAYCPTTCDLENATGVTVSSNLNEYNTLSKSYQLKYPGKTIGGNIDKSAILNIINTLPPATNVVNFRFCKDEQSGHTSVIFMGENLFIRNGGSSAAYCPTSCD